MLFRFIVDKSEFNEVIALAKQNKEHFIVLKREDSFFTNRREIRCHGYEDSLGMFRFYEVDDTIVYTDDETMLNYVPFVNNKYALEFKFSSYNKFIPVQKLHPNLRLQNNLTAMYQKRYFHIGFEEYLKKDLRKNHDTSIS